MKKIDEYKTLLDKLEVILTQVIPQQVEKAWMEDVLSRPIEASLDIQEILAPARDLLNRGGKRWRPLVMLLTLESLGVKLTDEHFLLSLCIELPHNGSLIIDDIEDKSDTRRGEPAIHKIYGDDMAINTGNFLYFLPTYLLENLNLPADQRNALTFSWLKVMRRLHIGQGLDIRWHNNTSYLPSKEEYMDMCRWKTGALAGLAGHWGALLGGLSPEKAEEMGNLWEDIGVAFQILDDTINLKTGNVGKRKGDDLLEGKKSYPLLVYATRENPSPLLDKIKELGEMKNQLEQNIMIDSIIALLNEKDCLLISTEDGKNLLENCKIKILAMLPENKARELIINILESFTN